MPGQLHHPLGQVRTSLCCLCLHRRRIQHSVMSSTRRRAQNRSHTMRGGRVSHLFVNIITITHFILITCSQVHAPILFVIILFPLSTALVLFCLYTLPMSVSWPRNLTDLAQLGRDLHGYSQSGLGPLAHVVGVMSIIAIWKHAWSIPGSVIWVGRPSRT